MKFTKMHGNGNDFVVIENIATNNSSRSDIYSKEELSEMAVKLCNRKTSIGADGVLVMEEHRNPPGGEQSDFRMRLFNADGSEAEMCGNGARCIAKYAFCNKICGVNAAFSTPAGIMRAVIDENSDKVDLDMGKIVFPGGVRPQSQKMHVQGHELDYVFLTVGVPHCVVFADNIDLADHAKLFSLGREIRRDTARFPKGANVNFVKIIDGDIWNITYERGVEDLTESCGTGSVAAAVAMECVRGCENSPLRIRNSGGINEAVLRFNADKSECYATLKGGAIIAFTGEVSY